MGSVWILDVFLTGPGCVLDSFWMCSRRVLDGSWMRFACFEERYRVRNLSSCTQVLKKIFRVGNLSS